MYEARLCKKRKEKNTQKYMYGILHCKYISHALLLIYVELLLPAIIDAFGATPRVEATRLTGFLSVFFKN